MVAIRSLDDLRAQTTSRAASFTVGERPPRGSTLSDLAVPDTNGNGVYDEGDRMLHGARPASPDVIAGALVRHLKANPAKVVSLGEIHGGPAERRYRTIIAEANRQGLRPVAAIEAYTNPAFKALTERLYAGSISPADYVREGSKLLYADYEARGRTHPYQGGPALYIGAFELALKRDVLPFFQMKPPVPVVFIDRERFTGRNREAGMAAEIIEATKRYPDRTIFAQVGVLHGNEAGRFDVTAEARAGKAGDAGVIEGYVDGDRPALTRVAAALGRAAVLSVAFDENRRDDGWLLARPGGIEEVDYGKNGGKPPFSYDMYDFYIRTKPRS